MLGKFWKQNDSSMVFDTCENVSQRFRMMGLLLDQIKKLVSLKCKKRFLIHGTVRRDKMRVSRMTVRT